MPKLHNIEAKAHKQLENGSYRVKVSVLDLGMYLNGCRVLPPSGNKGWTVYPPQVNVYGNWIDVVEFNKKLPLWIEVYEAAIEAAKTYSSETKDFVLTDISNEPINLDDIPY